MTTTSGSCSVGAADAVVAHLDREQGVQQPAAHGRPARLAVPGDVGQRLADREVRGDLDRARQAARQGDVDVDLDRGAAGGVGDGGPQATVGQDLRVDAADQLAQLGEGLLRLLLRLVDACGGGRAGRQVEPGEPQRHRQRDQALLGAVVEVALDAPPLELECVDQAGARAGDLDQPLVQLRLAGRQDQPGKGGTGTGPRGEQVRTRHQRQQADGEHRHLGDPPGVGAPQRRQREAHREDQGEGDHGEVDQPQHQHGDDAVAELQGAPPGSLGAPVRGCGAALHQAQPPALVPRHHQPGAQQRQEHRGQHQRRDPRGRQGDQGDQPGGHGAARRDPGQQVGQRPPRPWRGEEAPGPLRDRLPGGTGTHAPMVTGAVPGGGSAASTSGSRPSASAAGPPARSA